MSVLEALLGLEGVERGQVSASGDGFLIVLSGSGIKNQYLSAEGPTLEAAAQAIAAKVLEEARRQAKVSKRNLQRIEAAVEPSIIIVPAPGDRCGGSRLLEDGSKCPGCRACA